MSAIKYNYKNRDYILEFSRRTASIIERNGFRYSDVGNQPNTMIPLLVQGAFMKNHSNLKPGKIDEIFDSIKGKNAFITKLVELYLETVNTLAGDEDDEGNVNWEEI
jgi:hypothetical protein